jgi:hypothetical protein
MVMRGGYPQDAGLSFRAVRSFQTKNNAKQLI